MRRVGGEQEVEAGRLEVGHDALHGPFGNPDLNPIIPGAHRRRAARHTAARGAIDRCHLIHYGLAVILVFVGDAKIAAEKADMATTRNTTLDGFIAAYAPEIAALTHASFDRLELRIPGATILAYNYYNALAIGWAPDDVTSHGVLSLALYPRWVNLCLLHGIDLPDPHKVLEGSGNQVRTIRLTSEQVLDDPRVDAIIGEAIARSEPPFDPTARGRIIIKGTSPTQRSRRPLDR